MKRHAEIDDHDMRYLLITSADDQVRASNPRRAMKVTILTSNGNLSQRHKDEGAGHWKIHFAACARRRSKVDVDGCSMGCLME